jgi:hypothetical protein
MNSQYALHWHFASTGNCNSILIRFCVTADLISRPGRQQLRWGSKGDTSTQVSTSCWGLRLTCCLKYTFQGPLLITDHDERICGRPVVGGLIQCPEPKSGPVVGGLIQCPEPNCALVVFPPEEAPASGPLSLIQLPGRAFDDVEFLIPDDNDTRVNEPLGPGKTA